MLLARTVQHGLLPAGTVLHRLLLARKDCTSETAASWGCTPRAATLGLYIMDCFMRVGIVVIDRKKDKVDRKDGKDSIVVSRK